MSCSTGIFAGMDQATLSAALSKAQAAYLDLSTGSKGVTFSYAQGDGSKTVSYTPTNVAQLMVLISQLQQALGINPRPRRSMRFLHR
jgi:hypothetical protein